MAYTMEFIHLFWLGVYHTLPILVFLVFSIVALGQIAGRIEHWSIFDALYWSLITALTVGYGDFHPQQRGTKVVSVLIGLVGFMLTGIIVAITVHAATKAFEKFVTVSLPSWWLA